MDYKPVKVLRYKNNNHSELHNMGGEVPQVIVTPTASVDESKERGNWSSGVEFLLSCLSYAVGLGNVWRFPYLVYRNGGGAFLIPYTIMLLFVGIPMFLLEVSFGQYASEGPISIWKVSPIFQGIGYAMFLMSALVGIYYNMILAYALFYLWSSITTVLPWSSCDNFWNTKACRRFDTKNCTMQGGVHLANGTCVLREHVDNDTWANVSLSTDNTKMASDEYFHNFVLDMSEGLHDIGGIRWELAFSLLACWICVFCCLLRGVKTMGKVVYFTALFPYVVLVILLCRSITLEGAMDGIMFYLTPQWERLLEARVWGDAAMQIFFSLSPCWGGIITLASYNRFHNNCFKDTMIICFGNAGTCFFAGFVIFSIVGFMANKLNVTISKVASQGAGLAFVAYPEAVTHLPIPPFWAFIFFVMLMTLGMGTQFTIVETVVTTIVDTFPQKLRQRKPYVLGAVCVVMYLLGVLLCTKGGMFVLQLMDDYCATYSALMIGLAEVTAVMWVYGVDRFMEDMKVMLNDYPYPYHFWRFIWKYGAIIIISAILMFTFVGMKPTSYGDYVFPPWATALGWFLSFISVSAIPIVACVKVYNAKGDLWHRIKTLSQPTADWGPKLQMHRMETHSPQHTDSQIPLALPNYNPDGDYDDEFPVHYTNSRGGVDGSDAESESGINLSIPQRLNNNSAL